MVFDRFQTKGAGTPQKMAENFVFKKRVCYRLYTCTVHVVAENQHFKTKLQTVKFAVTAKLISFDKIVAKSFDKK